MGSILVRLVVLSLIAFLPQSVCSQQVTQLAYSPAPPDNPLKGLVPYAGDRRDRFPHSMEFNYVALAELMRGYEHFDWQPLDRLLDDIASRGHQAVVRVYLEYPGKLNAIPQFLRDDGLLIHRYVNTNTQPLPPTEVETPDYESPKLRRALKNFIRAFGQRYDGDPRLGYITAGLLGTWGEWHTYPRTELFASKQVQSEVMDAYQEAFKKTPVLLRYPAGKDTWGKAPNDARPFGYHDDSFAWATLDTGRKEDNWYYMPALESAGRKAVEKWKKHPIGGEIRPEAWGIVFDEEPGNPQVQDFRECVKQTHVTWLMDSGMFGKPSSDDRYQRAIELVRGMGYEFYVRRVSVKSGNANGAEVFVEVLNRGVAPFYHDWKIDYAVLNERRETVRSFPASGKLTGILPDDTPHVWKERFDLTGLESGTYSLLLQVKSPLPNGMPLRFANATQDQDLPGWLTLSEIKLD